MRIVIDMQGIQTDSRFRGIGRYTDSLVEAIIKNRGNHEIFLVLNGLFQNSILEIRSRFGHLLPVNHICAWYAPGPVGLATSGNDVNYSSAKIIRDYFIASLKPDAILITSLFEGGADEAVIAIGEGATSDIPTAVILYDLIPLIRASEYLPSLVARQLYQKQIHSLNCADLCLTISESTLLEAKECLPQLKAKLTNISAACSSSFYRISMSEPQKEYLLNRFGVTRSFILYTGGGDPRKNLERLLLAYSKLSPDLRDAYQLVIAGKIPELERAALKSLAAKIGIERQKLILTGYVTDEDLNLLYNACTLFAFPSLHEGFGLPPLEAMTCGSPVIGSGTTSIPEVIGRKDVLFDPCSVADIVDKIELVLLDPNLQMELAIHGVERAQQFSWDSSATKAIRALEELVICAAKEKMQARNECSERPSLAFVSPIPPARSGIADYSLDLLIPLSLHYNITVIVAQDLEELEENLEVPVQTWRWFAKHFSGFDRVIYHFGNSLFHHHMHALLTQIPGVVVLHDFYQGNVLAYLEESGLVKGVWTRALYSSHGYGAVAERILSSNLNAVIERFPANFDILSRAQGIIVHSHHAKRLAQKWYGSEFAKDWRVIPLLRTPKSLLDRNHCRKLLGINESDFVVCSFGILNPLKLNLILLNAWLDSKLAENENCHLIFVGEGGHGEYTDSLRKAIANSPFGEQVKISGWVDSATYQNYLMSADCAVQLRTSSRGETSAAVLDCMGAGLPTIVNANGSMSEIVDGAVIRLPDVFGGRQLRDALELLWRDQGLRAQIGKKAYEVIRTEHSPVSSALLYQKAIEDFHQNSQLYLDSCIAALSVDATAYYSEQECRRLSADLVRTFPNPRSLKTLYLDITATHQSDLKTGIERVARSLVLSFIANPPLGYRVEPVYLSKSEGVWHYCYARQYTLNLLGCQTEFLQDAPVDEFKLGDVVLGLDYSGTHLIEATKDNLFVRLKEDGVHIFFLVHDLLPLKMPQFFPPNSHDIYLEWFKAVLQLNGAIGVTQSVAMDIKDWVAKNPSSHASFQVGFNHSGADVKNSSPTFGLTPDAPIILGLLGSKPSFLMVGTIEPRKGHLQTLQAFDLLWRQGIDVNLVIVGSEGWKGLADFNRRSIPLIVQTMRDHPEFGRHLFWLEGISDEYLQSVYQASTCLIAASEGEGFGLPLIEAADHRLPILARDIPVFKEVAQEHAAYFSGNEPAYLAQQIEQWLITYEKGEHPTSIGMKRKTWKQSAQSLWRVLQSLIELETNAK